MVDTQERDSKMKQDKMSLDTASPLLETPDLSPEDSHDNDSDSDYSQYDSPANSRPVSVQSALEEQAFEDVAIDDTPKIHIQVPSRPASLQVQDNVSAPEVVPEPQSPTDSGSDYSDPPTPMTSRPASMYFSDIEESSTTEDHDQSAIARPSSEVQGASSLTTTSPDAEKHSPITTPSPSEEPSASSQSGSKSKPTIAVNTASVGTVAATESISISPLAVSPNGSDYFASSPQRAQDTTVPVSPMTPADSRMSVASLQSIALSESSLGYDHMSAKHIDDVLSTPRVSGVRHMRKPSSLEILQNTFGPPSRQSTLFDVSKDEPLETSSYGPQENGGDYFTDSASAWQSENSSIAAHKRDSGSSGSDVELDWLALDKTEEQEKEDNGIEDESTAFLLARLEQENAKFTADPKSATPTSATFPRVRSKSRPLSIAHLKRLVSKQAGDLPTVRYSMASDLQDFGDAPPMTDLEFWRALVQDYPSTASRLPTLTTMKIRAGVFPPFRGLVWTSMSGARETDLEDAFEKLQNESSPYEGIINKDVGRSFPGVDLFRDADGEGQKMLGRVLKCFSLYDKDIGYCQGLGFLVGPLLMHMGEREAFCVLVRLMDHYALRPSFLPSLEGLHMRIFQFSILLNQHHPELSAHLAELGVEAAYLSQWFLSCFAVTCPLPLLFRIYDVMFAEGAYETVMRVALALFRRNENKMMASAEFEDVMQLLLGRGIWDVYGMNADDLVDDFTSLGDIVTHQRLGELEREFESKDSEGVGQSAGFLPDVQAAASRFLGRLWAPSHGHTPSKSTSTTLSPQSAEKDVPSGGVRSGFLRRTPSKSSIGTIGTITESANGSDSSNSYGSGSTAATDSEVHDGEARQSQADSMSSLRTVSVGAGQLLTTGMKEQQELHTQIEDLLMALSEMQREHVQLAAMLQKEREDRNDDHRVVKKLVSKLHEQNGEAKEVLRKSMPPPSRSMEGDEIKAVDKRKTLPPRPRPQLKERLIPQKHKVDEKVDLDAGIEDLLQEVSFRLKTNDRFSASFETKAQLRSNLARTREQLSTAEAQLKNLSERADAAEFSSTTLQSENESLLFEVEELRVRVNEEFKERQNLELKLQNLEIHVRMEAKAVEKKQKVGWLGRSQSSEEVPTIGRGSTHDGSRNGSVSSRPGSIGGLKELKLARRDSGGSVQSIRSMKSQRQASDQWPPSPTFEISPSPPTSETAVTSAPEPASAVVPPPRSSSHKSSASISVPASGSTHKPSASLSVPGFKPRTSSLATQAVLATPAHEVVPDEALLLELVNAKTAEAQAQQEVDELKRSLQIQKRQMDEALLRVQAETASARLEAEAMRALAMQAKAEAQAARAEVFDASPLDTSMEGLSLPVTPTTFVEEHASDDITPSKKPEPRKADTAPASSGGGWFWSKRTPSTSRATLDEK